MEVKSIMKKRILSILLVMSVMASIFALSAATTDAAVKPPTPSVTVVNGGSAQGLFVKWNSVGAYTSYQVAYRPAGNYGCGKGYTYRATANTNIVLTGLKSGTCYQVQVRAYRNGVYGNYSNTKSMTFVARPTLKCGLDGNGQFFYISWSKVSGANSYQLVKWDDKYHRWAYLYTGSATQYLDDNVWSGKTYKYQVRAMYVTKNNGTAYSAWSNLCSYLYYPTILFSGKRTENILTFFGGGKYTYEVNWKARNEKVGQRYQLRFKKNSSDRPTKTVQCSSRNFKFTSDYYYGYVCVRYLNDAGGAFGEEKWVALR